MNQNTPSERMLFTVKQDASHQALIIASPILTEKFLQNPPGFTMCTLIKKPVNDYVDVIYRTKPKNCKKCNLQCSKWQRMAQRSEEATVSQPIL